MKLFIVLLLLFTLVLDALAQKVGVKAGLDLSTMLAEDDYGTDSDNFKSLSGFHLGLIVDFPIDETFSFETGLLLLTKGFKSNMEENDMGNSYSTSGKAKLLYLDIPLTGKAMFDIGGDGKLFATFGPYIGVGLSGTSEFEMTYDGETETENEDIKWGSGEDDHLKRLDYGLTAGGGIQINTWQFGASYDYGLANISAYEDDGDKMSNRVFKVSVSYFF